MSSVETFDGAEEVRRAWMAGLAPDPSLTVSQWAIASFSKGCEAFSMLRSQCRVSTALSPLVVTAWVLATRIY